MSLQMINIYYGYVEEFSIPVHKKQKVVQVRDRLRKLGYRVYTRPVNYLNLFIIEMCGHEVFRCNLKFLGFNIPYNNDPVCQKAVNAVLTASTKFLRARSYLWLWMLIDSAILRNSETEPKDFWPVTLEQKIYDVLDCANCCGILIAKKTDDNKKTEDDKIIDDDKQEHTPSPVKLVTAVQETVHKVKKVKSVSYGVNNK